MDVRWKLFHEFGCKVQVEGSDVVIRIPFTSPITAEQHMPDIVNLLEDETDEP